MRAYERQITVKRVLYAARVPRGPCSQPVAVRSQQPRGETRRLDAGAPPTWSDLDKIIEAAMAETSFDITADGTSKTMMLHFRTRSIRSLLAGGVRTAIPRVKRIWIGRPDEARRRRGKSECLVRAEDPVGMKEWHYGETPPGSSKFGCEELGPGEHVISVQFLGGYQGIRIAIDERKHVATLPSRSPGGPGQGP
jgi:hypothetical protein